MRNFKYTAINLQGHKVKGVFSAADEQDLATQLALQKLYLQKSKPCAESKRGAFMTASFVSWQEIASFCRQFSVMLDAHMPILECLQTLRDKARSQHFKQILTEVHDDVKGGLLLSEAFDKHKRTFHSFFRSMIRVGEISENMNFVLSSLADHYEKDAMLRRKVKGAAAYPIFLAVVTLLILVLMLGFVIPTFRVTLDDMGVAATGLTAAVYSVSDFIIRNRVRIPIVIIAIMLTIFLILQTERGRYFYDMMKVKLPIIGKLNLYSLTARFSRGFGLLIESGMDLDEALDAAAILFENRYIKKRYMMATESVYRGMSLSVAFESYGIFPTEMVRMTDVGERTASLGEVFMHTALYFDTELDTALHSMTTLLQPIMLVIIGVIIGGMFVAVYAPMLSIMSGL